MEWGENAKWSGFFFLPRLFGARVAFVGERCHAWWHKLYKFIYDSIMGKSREFLLLGRKNLL
jgi:hypothetical protein